MSRSPFKPTADQDKPWCVYVLECSDGTYYTGITNDLERRLYHHSIGSGAKYTRSRLPVVPRMVEAHEDRSAALRREAQIKKLTRREKELLVESKRWSILKHRWSVRFRRVAYR